MDIEEKVKSLVAEQMCVDEAIVTIESDMIDDLMADSMDIVELTMTLEEEFNIAIPDDIAEGWGKVKDIVDYIHKTKA